MILFKKLIKEVTPFPPRTFFENPCTKSHVFYDHRFFFVHDLFFQCSTINLVASQLTHTTNHHIKKVHLAETPNLLQPSAFQPGPGSAPLSAHLSAKMSVPQSGNLSAKALAMMSVPQSEHLSAYLSASMSVPQSGNLSAHLSATMSVLQSGSLSAIALAMMSVPHQDARHNNS